MKVVDDEFFKLDIDFDFIVAKDKIYILRPAAFVSIADLDKYVLQNATKLIKKLSSKVKFISFDAIVSYVGKHIRAAKVVASLRSRDDLNRISRELFIEYCKENSIPYEIGEDGMISPSKGKEIDFLMLLDRRRFATELIKGKVECYEAPNRRTVV